MTFAFSGFGPWTYQFLLVVAVAMYPRQAQAIALRIHDELLLLWLNAQFLWRSWLLYRRLRRDFARLGLPIPAFRYVPLQQRISR